MRKSRFYVLTILIMLTLAGPARADGLNRAAHSTASEVLRLTTDRNAFINLDQDAASVVVNNPVHAAVMLDTPRLLIIMPRLPGKTSFYVLNTKGETIMQRDVIITNVQKQYVRIRRACGSNDAACASAAYFYCPDGCYEVSPVAPEGVNAAPPPLSDAPAPRVAVPNPPSSSPEQSTPEPQQPPTPSEPEPSDE